MISASSFGKMCYDMMMQRDDMSGDLHAHGARPLVADKWTTNNKYDSVATKEAAPSAEETVAVEGAAAAADSAAANPFL